MPDRTGLARMISERKQFRREGEDVRRSELVQATLSCIATLGMEHTTVREIAIKAGVTPGLIRHYFTSKEELVLAAYTQYAATFLDHSRTAVENAPDEPIARLATFITANLSAP
ncbi:MAG: TetR family transcriptional regulator, partial [Rhizobiaceae bacterium]